MSHTKRPRLNLESLDHRIVPARIDLRAAGVEALLADGAIAHQMDNSWDSANGSQSHGTGGLQTYLTVDADGVERGYNTDFRPVQFNASSVAAETRALQLSNVPIVTVGGVQYREFILDVDQIDANGDRQLSVDEVQIFTSTVNNLRNYNNANNTLRAGSLIESPIWSLDALNGSTNDWLQVRAVTNQGQAGELALLIPNALFDSGETYVYIYTRMGANRAANLGAEQWGVRGAPAAGGSASLSGQIYLDVDNNGIYTAGTDTAFSGIFIFTVTDPDNVDTQHNTGTDGSFSLTDLATGSYSIFFQDPFGYTSVAGIVGTGDGVNDGFGGSNTLSAIELSPGENGTGYGFLLQSTGG